MSARYVVRVLDRRFVTGRCYLSVSPRELHSSRDAHLVWTSAQKDAAWFSRRLARGIAKHIEDAKVVRLAPKRRRHG